MNNAAASTLRKIDKSMDTYAKSIFFAAIGLMYFLYTVLILGISVISPNLLHSLRSFTHILVCVFLMIRFNPFRRAILREHDQEIIFAAALFLLTTTGITDVVIYNLSKVQEFLKSFM
jgi:hypothetical protein